MLYVHLPSSSSGTKWQTTPIEEASVEDRGEEANLSPDPAHDAPVDDVVTEKLQNKFGGDDGPLSDEEVATAVEDANDELRDAPVQAFTSLIAENKARNRLQERANDVEDES
jgi:hypothetical protein